MTQARLCPTCPKISIETPAALWYNARGMKDINQLRQEIDRIDASIVQLLKERMECVHEVGLIKKDADAPLFVPERESAQMQKLAALNAGVLPEKALQSIYRQIISCGYLLEGGLRVAYLGPEGTWSHQAARERFGESVELMPYASFDLIFKAIERGDADYGVLPIENSTYGFVSQTMDPLMVSNDLSICAQSRLHIRNCLLASIPREQIRTLYSHPQVLGQCRRWLHENFPAAEQVATKSTAVAARIAKEEAAQGAAALGSRLVAELYGLDVLEADVQDEASNTTRFIIIGKQPTVPTGRDRTSICFGVANTPGTLAEVLTTFKQHNINIHCLDARPSREAPWQYLFFMDVEGHRDEEPLKTCLAQLQATKTELKVLGSYPEQ